MTKQVNFYFQIQNNCYAQILRYLLSNRKLLKPLDVQYCLAQE
jgi:hypothetical protein